MSNARAEELRSAGKDAKMAVTLMRGHAGKQERQKRVLRALGLMYVMNTMYLNTKRAHTQEMRHSCSGCAWPVAIYMCMYVCMCMCVYM